MEPHKHRFAFPGFTDWKGPAIDHFLTIYAEIRRNAKVRFTPREQGVIDMVVFDSEENFKEIVERLNAAAKMATAIHEQMQVI